MTALVKACSNLHIFTNILRPRAEIITVPNRGRKLLNNPPKKRIPPWLPKQTRTLYKEEVTSENQNFIQDVIKSQYGTPDPASGSYISPLKMAPIEPAKEWTKQSRRTGVIARKIGIYPLWLKNGKKVLSTLLHVCDNHVIKYIPPEEWEPKIRTRHITPKRKLGCLVVGADSMDPQLVTKEYYGLFTEAAVMPKRLLCRFSITPDGALQPGTPLYAAHFKPGEVVDIRAKTMDRGFQGVMKRWDFSGMPATHGVTKTHRRGGNIGSGGEKARVMPGTKMPGHMGNRYRMFRGVKILRVNTKYNVIWVLGQALPGETNSLVQIYDTLLPRQKFTGEVVPHFPTYIPGDEPLPEELIVDNIHLFGDPSITYDADEQK